MRKRDVYIIAAVIALALVIGGAVLVGDVMSTDAWRLHFPYSDSVPQGPVSAEKLALYDAAYLDTSGGIYALD